MGPLGAEKWELFEEMPAERLRILLEGLAGLTEREAELLLIAIITVLQASSMQKVPTLNVGTL